MRQRGGWDILVGLWDAYGVVWSNTETETAVHCMHSRLNLTIIMDRSSWAYITIDNAVGHFQWVDGWVWGLLEDKKVLFTE